MVQVILYLDLNLLEIFSNNIYIKPYVLLLKTDQTYSKKTLCVKSSALNQKILKIFEIKRKYEPFMKN